MEINEFCPYCDHFMEEGIDPMIDFPCLHRAHSSCFLQLLNNETFTLAEQYRRCHFCAESLFETEGEGEGEGEQEEELEEQEEQEEQIEGPEQEEVQTHLSDPSLTYYERIRKRFHENKEMQKDVKAYIKAKRACGPKRVSLQKFTAGKKQEIKHSVESLREQLGSLLKAQKKIICQSQPYREYKGVFFRVMFMRSRISRKYSVNMDDLRKAVKNEKGYKQWKQDSRWRDMPNYIVRRSFYRRYIRC